MNTPENILLPEDFIAATSAIADIEHDYLAKDIGEHGKIAALDESELYRQAITDLSPREFATLSNQDDAKLEAMDPTDHSASLPDTPTHTFVESSARFLDILDELYGETDGYRVGPIPVAIGSLSIQAGEFFTEEGAIIIDATVGKDGLHITKEMRSLDLSSSGAGKQQRESLPVLLVVGRAVTRLVEVSPALRQRIQDI